MASIPYSGITERLDRCAITKPLSQPSTPVEQPRLFYCLLIVAVFLLGWVGRAAFLPYDYYQLAWLVPIVTLLIAWGNRRAT